MKFAFILSDFDFVLPERLIAQKPAHPRDGSRLLVIDRQNQKIEHRMFEDILEYFGEGDVLVANNSRVIRARLLGKRVRAEGSARLLGGKVECFLLEKLEPCVWECLFHASAKYVSGLEFEVPNSNGSPIKGVLIRGVSESPNGTVVVRFDQDPVEAGVGALPLPPYIGRVPEVQDQTSYQTVYAKEEGSVAAPTAGLHFSPELLARLKASGVLWQELTLHVGLGTFRPVKTENILEHQMHSERYAVSPHVSAALAQAKTMGKRVCAVGTTSVRTLESACEGGEIREGAGRTEIFIYPGYSFKYVDRLLTNFHLPKSTLLMLVSAFAGHELVMRAYQEAVAREYRFFSYGDAMLVL
ncbi:tRNA preQ1(34) S-adenosylmethionine ribosyltransferase-isomerase QueA [Bdellovibrionota bacterium FG-2]